LSQPAHTTGTLAELQWCSWDTAHHPFGLAPSLGPRPVDGRVRRRQWWGGGLVTGANKGARGDGNGGEGPALATDARRDDNKNSDVQGDPAPALGKEMLYGTDEAARAAADDAYRFHE